MAFSYFVLNISDKDFFVCETRSKFGYIAQQAAAIVSHINNNSLTIRKFIQNVIQGILTYFGNIGYIGIFIISFLGSILIFIPVPYFPILITSAFNKELDPNIIALSATIGAVLAKSSIFIASYYGRNLLSNKTK